MSTNNFSTTLPRGSKKTRPVKVPWSSRFYKFKFSIFVSKADVFLKKGWGWVCYNLFLWPLGGWTPQQATNHTFMLWPCTDVMACLLGNWSLFTYPTTQSNIRSNLSCFCISSPKFTLILALFWSQPTSEGNTCLFSCQMLHYLLTSCQLWLSFPISSFLHFLSMFKYL